jgi:hypothetical protein
VLSLPNDTIASIFEFFKGENGSLSILGDDRVIIATASVCKDWQNNPILITERREASARLRQRIHDELIVNNQYPQRMIQLFRNCNLPIARLPALDLGDRVGDYIDFLRPWNMTHPVMRFKDLRGRSGIAFHVEGYANGQIELFDQPIQIHTLSGVLAVFKRSANENNWRVGIGGRLNGSMIRAHNQHHDNTGHVGPRIQACPNCPSGMQSADAMSYNTLFKLLAGQDPLFRIAQGYVAPQNPVLPPEPPAPQAEDPDDGCLVM